MIHARKPYPATASFFIMYHHKFSCMRAIWSGAIGFGLVNIPVRIFSATQDSKLSLDMLDKRDHANIRYVRVNADTGKEVPWKDIVKGYKYNNKYVVLTDEDFEKASPEKSKIINISAFVPADKIDYNLFETPYYLEPAKGGEKAYTLLREALKKSKKFAIGDFILRSRQSLCILQPHDDVIVLERIRFAEEIRDHKDLNIPSRTTVSAAEMKMALALIGQLTPKSFDIAAYKDTYDEALLKLVKSKAKAKGKSVPEPKFKIVRNKSKDLMEQLKASLDTKPAKKAS